MAELPGLIISLIPEPGESRLPRCDVSRDQEAHMGGSGGIPPAALPFIPSATQTFGLRDLGMGIGEF